MTQFTTRHGAPARGFVDTASALPTIPPAHPQETRTYRLSCKADIFMRHGHGAAAALGRPGSHPVDCSCALLAAAR